MNNDLPPIHVYGETALADLELIQKMYEALEWYYPRHAFLVSCNHDPKSRVLTIQLLYQDESNKVKKWQHGMLIHIKNLDGPDAIKRYARQFGGELLERFDLAREGANPYTWIQAKKNKLDLTGMI